MAFVTTSVVHDETIRQQIRQNRHDAIARFEQLGFTDYYCIRELMFPFSFIVLFPVVLQAYFGGDKIGMTGILQLRGYFPYNIHPTANSYAHVFGLGIKFVTPFDDGSLLITNNYSLDKIDRPRKYYRFAHKDMPLETLWNEHQAYLRDMIADGFVPLDQLSVADIQRIEHHSDNVMMGIPDKK